MGREQIPLSDLYTRTDYASFLPPGISTRVDEVLDFLRGVNERKEWFRVRSPDEFGEVISTTQSLVDKLKKVSKSLGGIEICLNAPLYPLSDLMEDQAKAIGREMGYNFAGNAAMKMIETGAWTQAQLAATGTIQTETNKQNFEKEYSMVYYDVLALEFVARAAAEWETVSDTQPFVEKENLGMILLEIYRLGASDIYSFIVNKEKRVVVDFPILDEDTRRIGCWADGDKELNFFHSWSEPCFRVQPRPNIDPSLVRRIEQIPLEYLESRKAPMTYITQPPY